jgi:hypothetical protein
LDKETSKIVGGDVVSGLDKNKSSEVAQGIYKICLAAIISDITTSPDINVEDAERAAKGPGENELAVAGNSTVGSDTVTALEDPRGNVFATERPEEMKMNVVQGFVDTHMAAQRGCVVSREDVTVERQGDNDQHQHFLAILDGLIDNKLAIKKRSAVLADIIMVGGVENREISLN